MKHADAMNEFQTKVMARRDEIVRKALANQIEKIAREQAREMLRKITGVARPKTRITARKHPIEFPSGTVLARGDLASLKRFRVGTVQASLASLAWNSLAAGGRFAGRATRADMTRYLMSYEQFKDLRPAAVSGAISQMLRRGLLVASRED